MILYFLLSERDLLQEGDEFWSCDECWYKVHAQYVGHPARTYPTPVRRRPEVQ